MSPAVGVRARPTVPEVGTSIKCHCSATESNIGTVRRGIWGMDWSTAQLAALFRRTNLNRGAGGLISCATL